MEDFLKYLESQDLRRVESSGSRLLRGSDAAMLHVVINPKGLNLSVETAMVVVVRDGEGGNMTINIADGGRLSLLEVVYRGAQGSVGISQGGDSLLQATILQLGASKIGYVVNLEGRGGDANVDIVQMVGGDEESVVDLRLAHMSADCVSRSLSKCVASGSARGEFHGLVYVAQDAQRTAAEQNSRNIMLSESAHIIAEPQLEIYADDVKCSHGATVGQMNNESIYYMMQRGLSEEQARKLQLTGFVSEVTQRCSIEPLRDALTEVVATRLSQL